MVLLDPTLRHGLTSRPHCMVNHGLTSNPHCQNMISLLGGLASKLFIVMDSLQCFSVIVMDYLKYCMDMDIPQDFTVWSWAYVETSLYGDLTLRHGLTSLCGHGLIVAVGTSDGSLRALLFCIVVVQCVDMCLFACPYLSSAIVLEGHEQVQEVLCSFCAAHSFRTCFAFCGVFVGESCDAC